MEKSQQQNEKVQLPEKTLKNNNNNSNGINSISNKISLPHLLVSHNYHGNNSHEAALAAAAAKGARMVNRQMTPPMMESTRRRMIVFQIFVCLVGAAMSASISVWMAVCSNESNWWRISVISGCCSLLSLLLAFVTFKNRKRKPVVDIEISPSILREHHKSLSNSMRKSTAHSGGTPSEEQYIQQIRRHSVEIAADSVRQLVSAAQHHQSHQVAKSSGNLLTVGGAADAAQKLGRKRAGSAYN